MREWFNGMSHSLISPANSLLTASESGLMLQIDEMPFFYVPGFNSVRVLLLRAHVDICNAPGKKCQHDRVG